MSFFSQFKKSHRRIVDKKAVFQKGGDTAEPDTDRVANRRPALLPSCAPKSQRSIRRQLIKNEKHENTEELDLPSRIEREQKDVGPCNTSLCRCLPPAFHWTTKTPSVGHKRTGPHPGPGQVRRTQEPKPPETR